jgi:hypothetical protein
MNLPKPEQRLGSSEWMLGLGKALCDQHGFKTLVETGTCYGWTAARASQIFDRVITVEIDEPRLHKAAAEFPNQKIWYLAGSSPEVLHERILPDIAGQKAIFWLDAHCQRPDLLPPGGRECPLLDELVEICGRQGDTVVLIDDARLFLAPPPKPHRADQWPNLEDIAEAIFGGWRTAVYLAVMADIFVAAPLRLNLKDFFTGYWRDHYCEPTFSWWSRT